MERAKAEAAAREAEQELASNVQVMADLRVRNTDLEEAIRSSRMEIILLTDEMERQATAIFDHLDELGGGRWLTGLLPHFDDERVALVAPRVRSARGTAGPARHDAAPVLLFLILTRYAAACVR